MSGARKATGAVHHLTFVPAHEGDWGRTACGLSLRKVSTGGYVTPSWTAAQALRTTAGATCKVCLRKNRG